MALPSKEGKERKKKGGCHLWGTYYVQGLMQGLFSFFFIAGAQRRERSVLSGLKTLKGCLGVWGGGTPFQETRNHLYLNPTGYREAGLPYSK